MAPSPLSPPGKRNSPQEFGRSRSTVLYTGRRLAAERKAERDKAAAAMQVEQGKARGAAAQGHSTTAGQQHMRAQWPLSATPSASLSTLRVCAKIVYLVLFKSYPSKILDVVGVSFFFFLIYLYVFPIPLYLLSSVYPLSKNSYAKIKTLNRRASGIGSSVVASLSTKPNV